MTLERIPDVATRPARVPQIPQLLDRKLYKTGQTRGADDDVIFQNRVLRRSTVLIPYGCWELCRIPPDGSGEYQSGFIVLLSPSEYFSPNFPDELAAKGLALGTNALVFYETRAEWDAHNPETMGWQVATSRTSPLGGQYVARVPATTADDAGKINRGFTTKANKGAGIRVYEYASSAVITDTRTQLEAIFWHCVDAVSVITAHGMTDASANERKRAVLECARDKGLLDMPRLVTARAVNSRGIAICPLCLEEFSAEGFFTRMSQAEGRLVPDMTITVLNLFHIEELRVGHLNHRPYNVGWGHHHCNVVVKDSGILKTLEWMNEVVQRNRDS